MPFARTAGIIQLDVVTQRMSRIACAPCDRLALSTMEELFSAEGKVSGSRMLVSFVVYNKRLRVYVASSFIQFLAVKSLEHCPACPHPRCPAFP